MYFKLRHTIINSLPFKKEKIINNSDNPQVEKRPKFFSQNHLFPKSKKKLLPKIYFYTLFFGGLLYLLYGLFPGLRSCPAIFGETVCAPFGIYMVLIASLPGYLIVANILKFLPPIPWLISLIIVIMVSFYIYYMAGKYLDGYGVKKTEEKIGGFVVLFFVILLLAFLLLSV